MNDSSIKHIIIMMLLMITPKMVAQTPHTPAEKQEKASTVVIKEINANGIDDAKEKQQTGKTSTSRMRDHFIDANGDGICDNREQGLGFRRGQMGTGKQSGRHHLGRHK